MARGRINTGTIGHRRVAVFDEGALGLGLATALLYGSRRRPRALTEAELAERIKAQERADWNKAVEQRKAEKRARKTAAQAKETP